ncbi:MAG TPA: GNAT family N-acetyltransferase [Streptosporangiaceae bacterium]|jgi:ribosomal-protein-alanine N-acetyltransferase|nr:GNAT family N-acetyltransferase [Streptosporangiaceae bacterium]HEX3312989.1 GNAT family N-acetyltransferase [Streptosporangiaceae bacterium]
MQVFTCISQSGTELSVCRGLIPPSRDQGYGSEAVAAVTEWLLSQPGVREVRAHTLTDNAPSRRVLEKAGFTYVGLDEGEAFYQRP